MAVPAGAVYIGGVACTPDGAVYVTPTGTAAITGGTLSAVSFSGNNVGMVYPATVGGIPLIGLSSGSVSAAGAITGITALPLVYPAAYCFFPANILATSIPAGWYYCTFSSTTAGTAFLNTYTSGTPTIPASPTAVTDGKGAFTGDITTETALTINIAANALGATGGVRVRLFTQQTNNANVKQLILTFGGTTMAVSGLTSTANGGMLAEIVNSATNKQLSSVSSIFSGLTTLTAGATVDTTAQVVLAATISRATATDNIVLYPPTIEIIRAI